MGQPSLALITQQIAEERQTQKARYAGLSRLQQMAQLASYRAAQKRGDAAFHPFAYAIAS